MFDIYNNYIILNQKRYIIGVDILTGLSFPRDALTGYLFHYQASLYKANTLARSKIKRKHFTNWV